MQMTETPQASGTTPEPQEPLAASGTSYTDEGEGWVTGNLTREPEARFTPSGAMLASMRVAYTPRVKNPNGPGYIDQPTIYHDVTVWRAQAENVIESLTAGSRVVIIGRWQRQHWVTAEGESKSRLVLVASEVGASLLFRQVRVLKVERQGARS